MVENTVHSGSNLFRANSHNQQRWLLKMYRIQRLLRHSVGDVLFERERRSKRKMGPSLLPDSAHQRSTRQSVRILCNDFSKCSKELLHLITSCDTSCVLQLARVAHDLNTVFCARPDGPEVQFFLHQGDKL